MGSRFKASLTNPTDRTAIFGTEFVVKYGHAKHEILVCCPQHGALTPFRAVGEFSAVTITVSEPFLQPTAEIGAQSCG